MSFRDKFLQIFCFTEIVNQYPTTLFTLKDTKFQNEKYEVVEWPLM